MSSKQIVHNIEEMRMYIKAARGRGECIGFVPTMGALHEGHLSLVRRAAEETDTIVLSIFVNPIQFDDPNDLSAYPQTLASDAETAFGAGADVVFAPGVKDMYPDGFSTFVDMTGPSDKLCGASRLSHFRGVLTVVAKLFGICMPHKAYFGEKDSQQLAVVTKMVNELCMNVTIVPCPTVRESDGLAMSSRNARLSQDERAAAICLHKALSEAATLFEKGEKDAEKLRSAISAAVSAEPLARIDYADVVDPLSFDAIETARAGDIMALAVFIGDTRLIDNRRLG